MKKIHFTGIGGAGMAPLAELSLARGFAVSGSDMAESPKCRHLETAGAEVFYGHREDNLPDDADLLVFSSAVTEENCERKKARRLGIREIRRGGYLAELSAFYRRCVSVTGTHGKSSISSALAMILRQCGKDPGFMIGAEVAGLPSCASGDGDIFITEADESDGTHTLLKNFLAVVPNIEDDHEWSLGGKEVLENNFRKVAANSAKLLYYASPECDKLFADHPDKVRLPEIPDKFGDLRGFQAANAFIAAQAAILLGCEESAALAAAQKNYPQVARRMTVHKETEKLLVVEDYAHHPTEVKAAISLLRFQYPGRHLRILFQPHRFARLEKYFSEFVSVLSAADSVFVAPVFAAWSESGKVDSVMLANEIGGTAVEGSFEQWAKAVKKDLPENSVIAVLGAGDINQAIQFI